MELFINYGPIGSHIPLKHDSAQLTAVGQLLFVGHVTVQLAADGQFATLRHTNISDVSQSTAAVKTVPPFSCEALKLDTVLLVNKSFALRFLFFMVINLMLYTLNFVYAVKVSAFKRK